MSRGSGALYMMYGLSSHETYSVGLEIALEPSSSRPHCSNDAPMWQGGFELLMSMGSLANAFGERGGGVSAFYHSPSLNTRALPWASFPPLGCRSC